MASNIKFKRSAVQNRVPTTAQLDLGELALNTYDGKLYTEINTGSAAVVEIGSILSSLAVNGDNGAGGGDVVFHGQTANRDLTWDYSDDSLNLADNVKLKVGNIGDLFIYHNGGSSFIQNVTNDLKIISSGTLRNLANNVAIQNQAQTETMAFFTANGSARLYFDNVERVTTTADGADIGGTGSLKLPVGTTAQRNSSPASGDIRFNSTLGSFEGYSGNGWGELGGGGIGIGSTSTNPASGVVANRIGVGFTDINVVGSGISVTGYGSTIVLDFNDFKPGSFHRSIHNYTATAGQTTFAGLNYVTSEKQIAVYLNGARLSEATYTATSGTTVVLDVGASLGDEVEIINIHTNSDVDRKVNTYTATAGQTTFTGLSYNSKQELDVYLNGIRLASDDYTATSGNTVVLAVGASVNDTVDIVSTGDGITWRSTTDASGDRFTLTNVGIGTDQTPDKLNVRGNSSFVGVTTFSGDVTFTGASRNATWDSSEDSLVFKDNALLGFGNGSKATIRHSGSQLFFNNDNGNLYLRVGNENGVLIIPNSSVRLYHDGDQKFETTSTGITASGTQHIFTSGTSGDCTVIIEADTDNNPGDENENPKLVFRQDGGIEEAAIGMNLTNVNANAANEFFIASGINEGAIVLATTSTNGYTNAIERLRITPTGNIQIPVDSGSSTVGRLQIGASQDLEIYHDSFNSIIEDSGSGNLMLKSNMIVGRSTADENLFKAFENGAVELYHNNVKRFETTSTGASVTGNLTVSGVLTYDDVTNIDSVGIITARSGLFAPDNASLKLGNTAASPDLEILHNASENHFLFNQNTFFKGNLAWGVRNASNQNILQVDGSSRIVELYGGGIRVVSTASAKLTVRGGIEIENAEFNMTTNGNKILDFETGGSNHVNFRHNPSDSSITTFMKAIHGGGVELYHDSTGVKKFETTSNGVNVTGRIFCDGTAANSRGLIFNDSVKISLGSNNDLEIYHDGSHSFIDDIGTGNLKLRSNNFRVSNADESKISGTFVPSGAVELYHNNSKKFETTSSGATVSGQLTAGTSGGQNPSQTSWATNSALNLYGSYGGGIAFNDNGNNGFVQYVESQGTIFNLKTGAVGGSLEQVIRAVKDGQVELFYNNTQRFRTTNTGAVITGICTATSFSGNGANITNVNADTVDGIQGGSFLRGDVDDTTVGHLTFNRSNDAKFSLSGTNNPFFIFNEGTTQKARIQWSESGYLWLQNHEDNSVIILRDNLGFSPDAGSTIHKIFHAGNDGSGSGLDADTLDGVQGSSFLRSDADDTTSGHLTLSDSGYSIGNEFHVWKRDYVVNSSNPKELLYEDGNSLPDGGSYRFTAHISGTGTDNFARAVYWNQNGTWKLNVTYQSGTSSNHPEFIISSGVPTIATDHSSNYTIHVLGERIELGEGTGSNSQDNRNGFGADGYFSSTPSDLRYNRDGSGAIGSGDLVWHAGNDGAGSGLNADLLDGIDSGSFLRSDAADVASGDITFTDSGQYPVVIGNASGDDNGKLLIRGSANPYIRFRENNTDKAYIQWSSSGILQFVNQESGEYLRIKSGSSGLTFTEGGNERTVFHTGNDGSGSGLDADTLDGVQGANYVRTNQNTTITSDLFIGGGAGGITVNGGSDIRFNSGTWTGNTTGAKIQAHSDYLYIVGGPNGIIFRESGTDRARFDGDGHFRPSTNNTYDLGTSSIRWRNIYTNDLNLSNEGSANDVDGTWGNFTIQEGEDDLFLINKRNGKKYKFNLTEV